MINVSYNFGGYWFPLVTRILISGWLPVTTGYQNFRPRLVTRYHWLSEFRTEIGYRLPLLTKLDDLDRLPSSYKNLRMLLFKSI